MGRRVVLVVAVLGLTVGIASAQEVNARAVLQASLKAMGGENLKTIEYSGAGSSSLIGQQYDIEGNWPQYEVADYTRIIDFDARWSREDYTRRQGNFPTFGRTPMTEQRVTAILSGTYAWDMRDNMPVPLTRPYLDGIPYADLRQLELAITPHGFLKAALAASDATAITLPIVGASDFGLSQFGRQVTIVSFTLLRKYKINGTINDQNLVELVGTWFPNPVYGDMDYEMRYTQYRDFGGVKFPMLIHTHQGDPRVNVAHNYYEYRITSVKPNAPLTTMPVPDVVRTARPSARVEAQKLADGVWLLGGGTHNSLLVEFKDYVAVVEAPNNEARSLAVIAEAGRLVPGKPIRYMINTHHHFDHAGGLRTFLSQGTTIVTHESNKQYYLDILFHPSPRTLQPDRMALYNPMYWISRRPAPIETVAGEARGTGKYVVTDGVRILEVLHVQDMAYELGDPSYRQGNHSLDMLIAYLPKEKILLNADLYSPPPQGGQPQAIPTTAMRTLHQNMLKLKLDVEQHVPIHGRVGTNDEFMRMFANTGRTN